MFLFGLFVGLAAGGIIVAAYLNNIHSSKVKSLEDKITSLLGASNSTTKK